LHVRNDERQKVMPVMRANTFIVLYQAFKKGTGRLRKILAEVWQSGISAGSDALRHRGLAERYTIEKPKRADDLVQRRPRDPRRNQMNLEGVDIFQAQTIRGATKIPA
jgi:hypothetical protein